MPYVERLAKRYNAVDGDFLRRHQLLTGELEMQDSDNTSPEAQGKTRDGILKATLTAGKGQAMQVLRARNVAFEQPHPDVGVARIPIANASWVNTTEGTVLVDTLMAPVQGEQLRDKILETGGPIKHIIYTHGHGDHVGGAAAFKEDGAEIIAQRLLPDRLEGYRILSEHRSRITAIQFNVPFRPDVQPDFVEPTRTFDESLTFQLGGKTFELYHARAETDDAVWVHVPEIKAVFVGDLIIAGFPNIGNPFKPTRFALPWARALEDIRDKHPELLIAHGGRAVYQGKDAIEVLDANIEAIYSIHDQVVDLINRDIPLDEMIHMVSLPEHLKDSPYLAFVYSRPEFAVYNIYRWYHGYFDHNPSHLLPRPDKEVNAEIFDLIGGPEAILNRAASLMEEGKAQLAIQVLDVLLKADPENSRGRKLHLELLEEIASQDYCLMSRNTWVYFMEKDRELLGMDK
ncbi:MAG: alkyl sulfatase dimerization domain-containing protein [Desulfobacterales bacterium]